ncbi:hypothetical protein GGR56DRAFT_342530 [Xylariaceae sp. FL0804]|nr:hypothetical protein GGR56DRAFT_342530 [Xylariaceae sp. FL0804]
MPSAVESTAEPQPAVPNAKLAKGAADSAAQAPAKIIDIRQGVVDYNLKEEIISLFQPKAGPRKLPTLLLYDEHGLQLFEEITYLDEYYLTNDEICLLQQSATAIAEQIDPGSLVIELGSGNLRKVSFLLQAFEDAGKHIDYYALDLSEQELVRTLSKLPAFRHVQCHGLLGTYDDGREWLKTATVSARPKCILHLGSSIGNFSRDEASSFLKGFADALQPKDSFLIGVDSCNNPSKVYHAYNGITHKFILNGLNRANEVLGERLFEPGDWKVVGEYIYDHEGGRHQAFYSPIRDTIAMGETIKAGERVQVEQSLKFSEDACRVLWKSANMSEADRWMTDDGDYGLHLLVKPAAAFSLNPLEYAPSSIPTLEEWESLWAAWDVVSRQMLPNEELLDKPIKLRNACIFYLGHIPAFLDIQLTKTTGTGPTPPAYYHSIFERGIDPDVDNPEQCHAHSEIPDEWPHVDSILEYQVQVRARLRSLYDNGRKKIPRGIGRAMFVGFEHEIMHMETLLYMLLQSEKTVPPACVPRPDFESLSQEAEAARVENEWFEIPGQEVTIGLDDPENEVDSDGAFGWDNEKPSRRVKVHGFQAKGRPITNQEYMHDTKLAKLPASWAEEVSKHTNGTNGHTNGSGGHLNDTNGHSNGHSNGYPNGNFDQHADPKLALPQSFLEGKAVRTVFGMVPLKYALDWPVSASYDELAGCAAWMGGRIPTFEEARSIYTYVDYMKRKEAERKLGRTVPAVNAQMVNDGVEETPPSNGHHEVDGATSSSNDGLFIDLSGANVGLQNWHPTAVTGRDHGLAGQAEMGGVWEWTSSPLRKHEGFEPMALYPNYTGA